MSKPVRSYGWKKPAQKPKELHKFAIARTNALIRKLDLSPLMPPVYNQGELGSCTANAIAGAYEYCEMKENEKSEFTPSRLFIYYLERSKEGTIGEDDGGQISDGVAVVHTIGVCPENATSVYSASEVWPYDVAKFAEKPPQACYAIAAKHRSVKYKPIPQIISHIKQSIINGFPVIFGFQVYSSFEGDQIASDGILHLPQPSEQIVGGHAILCTAFDDDFVIDGKAGAVKIRNSWGADWGLAGYFWMPYDYITNPDLADDFWSVLQTVDQ
jgi:C1A family cysteine protease